MDNPEPKGTDRRAAARLSALWTAFDEHVRGKALASGLQAQHRAFRDALKEVVAVRDFVSTPEKILGSDRTKFGEVAEHVHVAVRRAKDVLHQRDPTLAKSLSFPTKPTTTRRPLRFSMFRCPHPIVGSLNSGTTGAGGAGSGSGSGGAGSGSGSVGAGLGSGGAGSGSGSGSGGAGSASMRIEKPRFTRCRNVS